VEYTLGERGCQTPAPGYAAYYSKVAICAEWGEGYTRSSSPRNYWQAVVIYMVARCFDQVWNADAQL
jgi:hypothetical protein